MLYESDVACDSPNRQAKRALVSAQLIIALRSIVPKQQLYYFHVMNVKCRKKTLRRIKLNVLTRSIFRTGGQLGVIMNVTDSIVQ